MESFLPRKHNFIWIAKLVLLCVLFAFLVSTSNAKANPPNQESLQPQFGKDTVVGQWRQIISNPKYKNSVAKEYMRHTFFADGSVKIQSKENSVDSGDWVIEEGALVVTTSYEKSRFEKIYKPQGNNRLEQTTFRRFVGPKMELEIPSTDSVLIRQGSKDESRMTTVSIFESTNESLRFIDPNTLEIGKTYTLSKDTPTGPTYDPMFPKIAIEDIQIAKAGSKFYIVDRKSYGSTSWYSVIINGKERWIKSIALFGQKLN